MKAFNMPEGDVTLKDVLDLFKRDIFNSMNCHHIGTVQSFDKDKQVVQATINYQSVYYEQNPLGGYTQRTRAYPILIDCPVVILGGGPSRLEFPIARGDECVLMFNDKDFDSWWAGSSNSAVRTTRSHSFSDAIALIGVRSKRTKYTDYDGVNVVLKHSGSSLTLEPTLAKLQGTASLVEAGASKVEISNATQNLKTIMDTFFTDLATFMQSCTVSTDPAVAAAAAIAQPQIISAKTNIGLLLK